MSWLVFALLSALMAALVAIFGKIGLEKVDSTLATTLRSIIMMVFLVFTSLVLGKFKGFSVADLSSKQWWYIVFAAVAGALSWLFYFLALKYGKASHVVAIDRLSVVFVVFLAAVFLSESLGWKSVLGAAMITGGAILISLN
jgi:transporter family protein